MLTAFLVAVAGLKILRLTAPSRTSMGESSGSSSARPVMPSHMTAYCDPARIPLLIGEPYDVAVLPGPALARAIAAGQLRKVGKRKFRTPEYRAPDPRRARGTGGAAMSRPFRWNSASASHAMEGAYMGMQRSHTNWIGRDRRQSSSAMGSGSTLTQDHHEASSP